MCFAARFSFARFVYTPLQIIMDSDVSEDETDGGKQRSSQHFPKLSADQRGFTVVHFSFILSSVCMLALKLYAPGQVHVRVLAVAVSQTF